MMKKPRNWSLKIYLISVLENKKLVVEKVTKLAHRSDRVDGLHSKKVPDFGSF